MIEISIENQVFCDLLHSVIMKRDDPLVRQSFVTIAVCFSILGHGCSMGFPAVLLPQLLKPDSVIQLDKQATSWLAAMMMIPVLAGNFLMPPLMDHLGRRKAHILVILPLLAGWIVCSIAGSFLMLTISRILHGLSFGMNLPLRSTLIGEYSSPKYRGTFLMVVSLAQASGIFIVHLVGSIIDWQKTSLACSIFPFIGLVLTLYTPESPSFLAAEGKDEKCRQVFTWLRGHGEDQELEDMIAARHQHVETSGFREFFKSFERKEFFKPVIIMIHIYGTVQFGGAGIMAVYCPLILSLVAGPKVNVNFWMIFLDAQRMISNLTAVYAINKFRRRTMLFSISLLCVASQLGISGYVFARNSGFLPLESVWVPLILINLQVFSVATGMVPLANVLSGEIFPFEFRGIGGSISVIIATLTSFFLLKTFAGITESIGIDGMYAAYSIVMLCFLSVVWFLLPETKGKTLQEIEDVFKGDTEKDDNVEDLQVFRRRGRHKRKMSVISKHSLVVDL